MVFFHHVTAGVRGICPWDRVRFELMRKKIVLFRGELNAAKSILLLPAIIVAGLCSACPQLPSPPAPPSPPPGLACTSLPTIQVLQPGYSPLNNPYTPPAASGNTQQNYPLRSQILDDLSTAFSNAPQTVKNDLCALTGVFIDSSSCPGGNVNNCQTGAFPVSWGYRSSENIDRGNMYIAIPGVLWAGGDNTHAILLSSYEQTVLNYFTQHAGNSSWGTTSRPLPTISSATPDASWAAVLAALSHELGHVKFNYTIHPNATHGRNYNFAALQPCSTGAGTSIPDFFSGWSYGNNPKKLVPKDTWRLFSHQESDDNGLKIDHSMAPTLNDFRNSANDPNQLLYTLYTGSNQPWASFWGAWSPDEDFVETYVLYTLSANVQHLYISINGNSPYDIISGVSGKPDLQNKIQCLANLPVI